MLNKVNPDLSRPSAHHSKRPEEQMHIDQVGDDEQPGDGRQQRPRRPHHGAPLHGRAGVVGELTRCHAHLLTWQRQQESIVE